MTVLDQVAPTLAATVRVSVPLVLAAFAGLVSERSGVVDIGLEGKMLAGAFAAATVAALTGNAWAGLGAAVLVALALGLLHGYACITQRGDQVVAGMAINILVSGLTVTLGLAWFHQGSQTPPLPADARFGTLTLPGAETVADIPFVGPLYARVVSDHNLLVYAAFLLVPFASWLIYGTRFGLRLRAVGENPAAVDTAGISVASLRYRAVMIAGALCGVAGAYIALAQSAGFIRDMTGGRGYLALAAMILGQWRPWPTLAACLLFALLDAIAIRLQGLEVPGIGAFPVQVMQGLPYVVTVVLLGGFLGRAIPPRASGLPYVKER
jgi:simple sugar transport system permease protein